MHVTFAKGAVGTGSYLGTLAISMSQFSEPIKFVGICGTALVAVLTTVSLGLDIRKKWRDRNK